MRTSTLGNGVPTLPNLRFPGTLSVRIGEVSVSPYPFATSHPNPSSFHATFESSAAPPETTMRNQGANRR